MPFQIGYVWWALGIAICAGFALGAHVVSVIGLDLPLGIGFYSFVQTHGHIQLIGWSGLFIIGISLHFIPRLAGVPIAKPERIKLILWLISIGLIWRFIGHTLLPYLTESLLFMPMQLLTSLSGFLEWLGILFYLFTIVQSIKKVEDIDRRPALKSVRPFFVIMLTGWLLYPTFNLALLLQMAMARNVVLNQPWNEFAIQLFISMVLLPVAFAFSVRMFPLYLRLPAIDWSVRSLALLYLVSIILYLVPLLPPVAALPSKLPMLLSNIGLILRGSVILWFIWKLDLFTRRRDPWTVHRELHPGPERRPTREGLPDYGEFGRFEWLVYSAYAWLMLGALVDILSGVTNLFGWTVPISSDAVRHIYLLGFITHLILGMSVRMLPGFIKKKRVAIPKLVDATFWLGNLSAFSRIMPLLLPLFLLEIFPKVIFFMQTLLALSGVIGLAAVICLAINLIKTAKL